MDGRKGAENMIGEPAQDIPVYGEADVVVVGGGPAGVSAAVAAARSGASTILLERYGHLGGMATGGLVILIPHLSDGTEKLVIAGQQKEWLDRLDPLGGVLKPPDSSVGSADPKLLDRWGEYRFFVVDGRIRLSAYVDPELLKCVLNDMVMEAGVTLCLHSWGCRALMDRDRVKGIVFESKEGRKAILGQVIVDTTGDGDILASAGADFDDTLDPKLRSSKLALVFRVGNIDYRRFRSFKGKEVQTTSIYETGSEESGYAKLMGELNRLGGFTVTMPTNRDDVLWFNNWIPDLSCLKVRDLTTLEVETRKKMLLSHGFFKKHVPGFENSYILDTASQAGTRGSRRLIGEHVLTHGELQQGTTYPDTIALFPPLTANASPQMPNRSIPYRSLLPRNVDRLLVAGRCFSSDLVANDIMNLIPPCVAMGEAAGTAAALAVKHEVSPRAVHYPELRENLISHGVVLPDTEDRGRS
ncbi:MAG: FAD-dependent oxidoreductase [Thermodesulfobacteriota bacterium]